MSPSRGFAASEYKSRIANAQSMMAQHDLDALLITTAPEFYYFTGYLTRFWESPTRNWFLLIPQSGDVIAVIPTIGEALMAKTHVADIRTWSSPDLSDDGISLLAAAINDLGDIGQVGIPDQHGSHLRMPIADFNALANKIQPAAIVSDCGIVRELRLVKSAAEIDKIAHACGIAGRAFSRVHEIAAAGVPLEKVFRDFQRLCLEEGADWVPYLAGAAGPDGYSDVISPATETPLQGGDILMLDTGLVWDGYYCDYDRNFAIGAPPKQNRDAHLKLIEATKAGFEAVKPGATASDVFHAMDKIVTGGSGASSAGRLGHGLGLQLTEWPSFIPGDETVLKAGMVLTLEPGIETRNGNLLVHEENIVVTQAGARYLSSPYPPEMTVIDQTGGLS